MSQFDICKQSSQCLSGAEEKSNLVLEVADSEWKGVFKLLSVDIEYQHLYETELSVRRLVFLCMI